jgi:hypothetical protein
MLVDTFHGKMKINLLANEPNNTPNEYAISFDSDTCCTAGLIMDLQKFKGMHIRETMNSDPSAPSFPENPTPAESRRPQYWQITPVGFLDALAISSIRISVTYFPVGIIISERFTSASRNCCFILSAGRPCRNSIQFIFRKIQFRFSFTSPPHF